MYEGIYAAKQVFDVADESKLAVGLSFGQKYHPSGEDKGIFGSNICIERGLAASSRGML